MADPRVVNPRPAALASCRLRGAVASAAGGGYVLVVGRGSCSSVCDDAVPAKVRAAVTGADVRLQLLGHLASRLHTGPRVWPDAGN